jgi:hypothetical protein
MKPLELTVLTASEMERIHGGRAVETARRGRPFLRLLVYLLGLILGPTRTPEATQVL